MNLQEIKSITLSLLKRETDVKENIAAYAKKVTATFTIPNEFQLSEENLEEIITGMYGDLQKNAPEDCDSIGIWIEMNSITLDNALSLQTLDDIQIYSRSNINPIWEFFKMTIQ